MNFMFDVLDTHQGQPHSIRRTHVFEDCVQLYSKKLKQILIYLLFVESTYTDLLVICL